MNINGIRVIVGSAGGEAEVSGEAGAGDAFWRPRRYVSAEDSDRWVSIGEPARPRTAVEDLVIAGNGSSTAKDDLDMRYYCELYPPEATSVSSLPVTFADLDYLLCVWWTPQVGTEEDYHNWFWQEHKPDLLAVPGWSYVRRFWRVSGGGPEFVALHYLQNLDVFQHPLYLQMQKSTWRDRVMETRIEYGRMLCRQIH